MGGGARLVLSRSVKRRRFIILYKPCIVRSNRIQIVIQPRTLSLPFDRLYVFHDSSQTPLPIHVQPRHATVAYLSNGELFQSKL